MMIAIHESSERFANQAQVIAAQAFGIILARNRNRHLNGNSKKMGLRG